MVNEGDLISVMVPVYQVEKYLRQCLESIIKQSYGNLDIILVDDGSTDRSGEICDEYAARDSRIQVIHKENGGLVSARKAGLKIAKGKLVVYVDSDDWIEKSMIEGMWNLMRKYDADAVIEDHYEEQGNCEKIVRNYIAPGIYEKENLIREVFANMLYVDSLGEWGLSPACWGKLLKKEFIEKYQYDVDDCIWDGEDHAFIYSVLLDSKKIVISSETSYHHRIREGSVAMGYDTRAFERFSHLYNHLKSQFSKSPYWDEILKDQFSYQMRWFLFRHIVIELGIGVCERSKIIEAYIFPFSDIKKGERIVLYGAGGVGKVFHRQIITTDYCKEMAWIDKKYDDPNYPKSVQSPDILQTIDYDKVVIAVSQKEMADNIKADLRKLNVPDEKMIWIDPYIKALPMEK